MIFCEKCFRDMEIISVIRSKDEIGECSICHSKNIFVYDTHKYDDLSTMFECIETEVFRIDMIDYRRHRI